MEIVRDAFKIPEEKIGNEDRCCTGKEMKTFTIIDITGKEKKYKSTLISDLRNQLAQEYHTFSACIVLTSVDGNIINPDHYNNLSGSLTLYVINNVTLYHEILQWNENEWNTQIAYYMDKREDGIFDTLEYCATTSNLYDLKCLALVYLTQEGCTKCVHKCLSLGCHNESLGEALVEATCRNYINIVSLVLQYSNNKIEDSFINIALHYACKEGYYSILQLLLNHGLRFENNEHAQQGLNIACRTGYKNIVELLLALKSYNDNNHIGYALKYACIGGHKDIVSLLLDSGIDIKQEHIIEAIQKARTGFQNDVITLLSQRGIFVDTELKK